MQHTKKAYKNTIPLIFSDPIVETVLWITVHHFAKYNSFFLQAY